VTLVGTYGTARVEQIMGMPIIVDVRDTDPHGTTVDDVFEWLRHVDETFSTYKEQSAISRLNRGELDLNSISGEVNEVLHWCEELRVATDGYFDARAVSPAIVDPSGLVKGWSVDRAGTLLDAAGAENYAIFAGGDILVRGGALPDATWRVGVQHPVLLDEVAAVLALRDCAIATSGAYARGDHVVDPHTRTPSSGLLSVTVIGRELATADAYATAVFAMGHAGIDWARRLPQRGYEVSLIGEDEIIFSTPGFPTLAHDQ